jgi:putative transposase
METQPRRAYPTDLNNKQWGRLATLFALPTSGRGRPRTWTYREILNAIFYLVRSGEAWRLLPHDFPPWQTVYG